MTLPQPLVNLYSYIKQCLKPRGNNELHTCDAWPTEALVQDAIVFVPESVQVPAGIEYVTVAGWKLCRNSLPRNIEWYNEETKEVEFTASRDPLYRRLIPPPEESVNHVKIITSIIEALDGHLDKTYVEYGVSTGISLEPVAALVRQAYGVDAREYKPKRSNISFHQCYTDAFSFSTLPKLTFQYAFIDADHSSRQVIEDFKHVFEHIQPGGYIFMHDTYPCEQRLLLPHYCNDCYLSPLYIKKEYAGRVELMTLPLNPGVTIVRKL